MSVCGLVPCSGSNVIGINRADTSGAIGGDGGFRWEGEAMFTELGPIQIDCDTPPEPVIEACGRLGFQTPFDVRWCRVSQFLHAQEVMDGNPLWRLFFGDIQPRDKTCTCGEPLPTLEKYTFPLCSRGRLCYCLGQCRRCRTIFWEEG
jgi:hypothetical protein